MATFQDTSGNFVEYNPSSPYGQTQGFLDALGKNLYLQSGSGQFDPGKAEQELTGYAGTFSKLFRQLVGRDPNVEETGQFYQTVVAPQGSFPGGGFAGMQELQDRTKSFVADNFQRTAEEQALLELQNQQGQANQLSQMFRTQGRQAISDTESRLQDYQTRLFEKLRPQLLTSLQTQGLLNTGGLNEAFAGAAKDLASESSNYLSDAYLQNEQAANAIAFGGASAPYELARQQAMNRVGYMQGQGESALNRAFQTRSQEMDFNNKLRLLQEQNRLQAENQPSFLKQLGGQILGNVLSTAIPGVSSYLGNKLTQGGSTAGPTGGPLLQDSGLQRYS